MRRSEVRPKLLASVSSFASLVARRLTARRRRSCAPPRSVILCIFYARLGSDYVYSLQDRVGLLYEFTALIFVGMLNCIAVFPSERNVYYREAADGAYSAASFLLTYTALEIPCELLSSLLFTVFAQAIAGAPRAALWSEERPWLRCTERGCCVCCTSYGVR